MKILRTPHKDSHYSSITCLVGKTTGYFFDPNQTIQSTGKIRTNSMENIIQHKYKYCLDMRTIILEMLIEI